MKKRVAIVLAFIILLASFVPCGVTAQDANVNAGYVIELNGEATEYTSVVYNNTHFVPLRSIFEKLGAVVYYRDSDRQILALSRDGDLVRHIIGSNVVTVNGIEKTFDHPSILENNQTYISVDMIANAFCVDGISYDNQQLDIKKWLFNNYYHKIVKEVLDERYREDFCPEYFQRYITYHTNMPSYTMDEVIYRVNIGIDYPFYENISIVEHPYELLVLVNKSNKLPENFTQYNLVTMDRAYTNGGNYLLAGVAYENYKKMADAAKQEGLTMRVVSAYRTETYQGNLYNNRVRTTGKANADKYSARPGHSEHQTGLAVDINSTKGVFEYTAEFKWLQKHAHEYGFILRYPKGKEWITGYGYEAWHYRYVGEDVAKIIYEEDITYEEYYAKYIKAKEFN